MVTEIVIGVGAACFFLGMSIGISLMAVLTFGRVGS